jgi:hypothetical protein
MTSKQQILNEIKRIAALNRGNAPGSERFSTESGIKDSAWRGKYWARWSDALADAGFAPNQLNSALSDEHVISSLARLVTELGKYPAYVDIRMKARREPGFPHHNVFARVGQRPELAKMVVEWCATNPGHDVARDICAKIVADLPVADAGNAEVRNDGFVYLMKSGKFYKIGRSIDVDRRLKEFTIQLPEALSPVHVIRTDDPAGIEAYWHKRFEAKRKKGEWFDLAAADVKAFKRRNFM